MRTNDCSHCGCVRSETPYLFSKHSHLCIPCRRIYDRKYRREKGRTYQCDCSHCGLSRADNPDRIKPYSTLCDVCKSKYMRQQLLKKNPEADSLDWAMYKSGHKEDQKQWTPKLGYLNMSLMKKG